MPSGKYYTTPDLKLVRELFPIYGARVCAICLGRSVGAIRELASKHGIKRDAAAKKAQSVAYLNQWNESGRYSA